MTKICGKHKKSRHHSDKSKNYSRNGYCTTISQKRKQSGTCKAISKRMH